MQKLVKKDIWFNSADRVHTISAGIYYNPTLPVKAVVQISHGMCEYIGRYTELAEFLAANGIAMAGNDHLGHGNSIANEEDYGHFTKKNGRQFVLEDLHTMNTLLQEEFTHVPVILLGHSMGSFYARQYAVQWPQSIAALIICGTGGPNPLASAGTAITNVIAKLKSDRYRSQLVHNIAFGAYLKQIENPATPYDWISRDTQIVEKYSQDPKCTFQFTLNGFHELFCILQQVSTPQWAQSLPKSLPIFMIAGTADPVGDYGKGVTKVYTMLQKAGIENIACKLYPDMRHEILNEIGRVEVMQDVTDFVLQQIH